MDRVRRTGPRAPLCALAPAKINLALHVVGQRPVDGYHLLETLVVFADDEAADALDATPASSDSLRLTGPYAQALTDGPDNLVLAARDWLRVQCDGGPVALSLGKNLPVASGVGGGSADAAAALRLLAELWQAQNAIGPAAYETICNALGADVAMCVESASVVARGIGEQLTPVSALPTLPAILVNPGVAVATSDVFAGLASKTNAPLPALPDFWGDATDVARWLADYCRNDLEAPARTIAPVIDECLKALTARDAMLARMSGSGATCFGLYATQAGAHSAAARIAAEHPDWWVRATLVNAAKPMTDTASESNHVQA